MPELQSSALAPAGRLRRCVNKMCVRVRSDCECIANDVPQRYLLPDWPTVVYAYPIVDLLTKEYAHRLAIRLVELGLSRPKSTNWLAMTLYMFEGQLLDANGCNLIRHDDAIDRAYGYELSFSWNTDFKRFAFQYPKQCPQARLASRFELWDVAFKVVGRPIYVD